MVFVIVMLHYNCSHSEKKNVSSSKYLCVCVCACGSVSVFVCACIVRAYVCMFECAFHYVLPDFSQNTKCVCFPPVDRVCCAHVCLCLCLCVSANFGCRSLLGFECMHVYVSSYLLIFLYCSLHAFVFGVPVSAGVFFISLFVRTSLNVCVCVCVCVPTYMCASEYALGTLV